MSKQNTSQSQFAIGSGRQRPPYVPKAIQCTQCGGALSLFSEQTQMITCDYCGSQLDASSEEYRVLDEKLEKRDLLFPVGMDVYHEDIKFKIIARMVFEGSYLDEDDDGKEILVTYDSTDYLLFHPRKKHLWLTECEDEFSISSSTHLLTRNNPFHTDEIIVDDETWKLKEKGTLELRYVDGALPWIAKVGDSVEFAEFSSQMFGNSRMYEVQQSKLEDGSAEIECAFSQTLSNAEIQLALRDNFASLKGISKHYTDVPRWLRKIAIFCSIFVCCLFVGSCWRGSAVPVDKFSFTAEELDVGTISRSFTITDVSKPVVIAVHADLDNAWMALDLAILEAPTPTENYDSYPTLISKEENLEPALQSKIVHVTDVELSYYSGYDGGESWSEGDLSQELWLVFPKPGEYRLMATGISEYGSTEYADQAKHSIYVVVHEGNELRQYGIAMFWLSFLIYCLVVNVEELQR